MKKIIIPILLSVLLIILYYLYENDEKDYGFNTTQERVEVEYDYKVLSETSTPPPKEEQIVHLSPEGLLLRVKEDRNITKGTPLTLMVTILNPQEEEGYNYFWREGDQLLGMGASLEHCFSKGKHLIRLEVKSTQGREANATISVTAWDYTKVDHHYYSDQTGAFLYTTQKLFDPHGNILVEKLRDSITRYVYDEEGNKIEEQYEDYEDASNNYTQYFEYDDQGNNISTESLNAQNVMTGYETLAYDEEGYLISIKVGKDEYSLDEILMVEESDEVVEEEVQEEDHQAEENTEEEKIEYDENGNIILYVSNDSDSKFMVEVSYNENNQTVSKKYSSSGEGYNNSRTFLYRYDEEGEMQEKEEIYRENDHVTCHFSHTSSHDLNGNLIRSENHVVSGDCSDYIENIVEEYQYDVDGNVIAMQSKAYDVNGSNRVDELHTTMRVERYYTNDGLE